MKGDAKVIELLNLALKNELTAVNQYWLHYRMLDHWGIQKLAHFDAVQEVPAAQLPRDERVDGVVLELAAARADLIEQFRIYVHVRRPFYVRRPTPAGTIEVSNDKGGTSTSRASRQISLPDDRVHERGWTTTECARVPTTTRPQA